MPLRIMSYRSWMNRSGSARCAGSRLRWCLLVVLLFAKRAQAKYGVPSHEILLEMARRKTVGGQEDLIEEIAIEMAAKALALDGIRSF